MSETASTAGAPATASAGTSAGSPSGPASSGSEGANTGAPTQAQGATNTGETQSQAQERILAEQDLDAFIVQKINGKEEKVRIRDLTKAYGLDKTANQRMQEAAQIRKQNQMLIEAFQKDPERFFELTGTNRDEWLRKNLSSRKEIAEEILAAEYERQELMKTNPEALRARELEERVKQFEQRDSQVKAPIIAEIKKVVPESMLPKGLEQATPEQLNQFLQVKQKEFQAGVDNVSTELLGAWQETGLPKVKEMGQWMAQVMLDHQKRTGEPLQPKDAAVKVKGRVFDIVRQLTSNMDAKAIQEMLGEGIVTKLRSYDVERVTGQAPQPVANGQAVPAANVPKKPMTELEYRQWAGIA